MIDAIKDREEGKFKDMSMETRFLKQNSCSWRRNKGNGKVIGVQKKKSIFCCWAQSMINE